MANESFDLRLLVPFAVLGEELHFGRAAARLGVGQPALSQQIARLERQLGGQLLVRDHRQVSLTPAGARFLRETLHIVARASRTAAALRVGGGELRIHLGEAVHPVVREILASFVAAHPAVEVRVTEGTGSESMQALADDAADVGFDLLGGVPVGFSYLPLVRSPLGIVCSPEYWMALRGTATWSDLDGEPIMLAPPGIADAWNRLIRTVLHRLGVSPSVATGPWMSKADYLVPLVQQGRATLVTAGWIFDPPPSGMVWIPLTPTQEVEMGVVWDERVASAAVRRFVAWSAERSLLGATAAERSGIADSLDSPAPDVPA